MPGPEPVPHTRPLLRTLLGDASGRTSRPTLPMRVAESLFDSIASGAIAAGSRLNEAEIAERMGTSRGPVREALRYLQEAGLIEAVPHQGSFVIEPSAEDLAEMVIMRSVVEGVAARLMIAQGTATLDQLDSIVDAMKETIETADVERYRELDWAFHQTLCSAPQMRTLLETWMRLRHRIGLMMLTNTQGPDLPTWVADHGQLVSSLRGCTPHQAEQLVRARSLERGYAWLGLAVPPSLAQA